jgi:uncharacterized protein (TIGR03435 family)
MTQKFTRIVFLTIVSGAAFGQSADVPAKFEIADVHVSPPSPYTYMQVNPLRAGRCEFHNASIIDLISVAYDVKAEKIVGGPSWLEMDRFDVIAKVPAGTKAEAAPGSGPDAQPDTVKDMLQSLLADRFKLALHKDRRSLPTYALTASKKLQLTKADGSGDTGCRLQPSTDPANTAVRYTCRNVSMEALASVWPRLRGTPDEPVVDKTELEGLWNFDMKWSSSPTAAGTGDGIGPADAIQKQLGLKLEKQQNPAEVLVVDRVNEKPTANPAGVAEALPIAPVPTEFDVVTVKPTDPDAKPDTGPTGLVGDRWILRGTTLRTLILVAFSPSIAQVNADLVTGVPGWAETEKFDIDGKKPAGAAANARLGPMLRSLLEDRFRMKSHVEERPVSVYVLEAGKSKMKESDPASRTHCLSPVAPAGSPPGSRMLECQNITMSQFAEQIRTRAPGPGWPVFDSTGIKGGWDFTLLYVRTPVAASSAGESGQSAGAPVAPDPSGGLTLIEALDKQLGLKLKAQKRPMPVTVIDHLEQKPTDN